MKVRIKRGGFFYDGRTVSTDEELEVSKEVGESWIGSDMADEVKSKKKRQSPGPSEDTSDNQAAASETR